MIKNITHSIFEALIDEYLRDALAQRPELRTVFGKINPEEQPGVYASFVGEVPEQALREESDPENRLALCNRILGQVADQPGMAHLKNRRLVSRQKPTLLEITPTNYATSGIPRPPTSLVESSLFTGSPQEPQLAHELLEEMRSADGVDILVSFIKWSGRQSFLNARFVRFHRGVGIPPQLLRAGLDNGSDKLLMRWRPDGRLHQ